MCYQLYILDDQQGKAIVEQLLWSHVAGNKLAACILKLENTTYALACTVCVYVVGGAMGRFSSCSTAS